MISTETGEARFASPLNAVSRDMTGPDLGNQEYAIALTGNRMADQSQSLCRRRAATGSALRNTH